MKHNIKYTPHGFSYVDVNLKDCINWGGYGICDYCGKVHTKLKLIWVLRDTYCEDCFNKWVKRCNKYAIEDIEYDLNLQKKEHIFWYEMHGIMWDVEK